MLHALHKRRDHFKGRVGIVKSARRTEPEAAGQKRGKGIGRQLIQQCLDWAKANGYEQAYLETMPELHLALKAYEQFGFTYLKRPLGKSGHFGCDRWMIKHI